MKKILIFLICDLFGLLLFTGCLPADQQSTPIAVTQASVDTKVSTLPTPAVPGDMITWQGIQVTMDQAEITDSFITEFGTQREPATGEKFLWVHIKLKNPGNIELKIPTPDKFSALYAASEFKPTYGHRQGHTDYIPLDSSLFPQQEVNAWLRFDIPVAAELKTLWFIFLPESSGVGVLPSSPNYPWAEDHPTFAWFCAP